MASTLPFLTIFSILLLLLLLLSLTTLRTHASTHDQDPDDFVVEELTNKRPMRRQKLSHFRLYWHDVVTAPKPTAIQVVKSPVTNKTSRFGEIFIIDDPLTLGPDLGSKIVGKAQGVYAMTSQDEMSLLMAMNFYFTYGKYKGSSITIMGRNAVMNEVREMPVISGSGLFRFANGYVQARTHVFDPQSFNATVEYNVHVFHY